MLSISTKFIIALAFTSYMVSTILKNKLSEKELIINHENQESINNIENKSQSDNNTEKE